MVGVGEEKKWSKYIAWEKGLNNKHYNHVAQLH